ncbi:MAG: hypothetical protein SOR72_07460 [Hornefia sp.]|nr:hypothetical protein [Hornefia sp.]
MIFNTFPELSQAYELKEFYRKINRTCSYKEACAVCDDIAKDFKESGIRQFSEFNEMLFNQ